MANITHQRLVTLAKEAIAAVAHDKGADLETCLESVEELIGELELFEDALKDDIRRAE